MYTSTPPYCMRSNCCKTHASLLLNTHIELVSHRITSEQFTNIYRGILFLFASQCINRFKLLFFFSLRLGILNAAGIGCTSVSFFCCYCWCFFVLFFTLRLVKKKRLVESIVSAVIECISTKHLTNWSRPGVFTHFFARSP